jgi:Tol biopolymer transport system component
MNATSPVSPDGRYVVTERHPGAYLVSLDGSSPPRALPGLNTPADRIAQWSRDSKHLYVYRRVESPLKVWLYDIETGQQQLWKEIAYDSTLEGVRVRITPDGNAWTLEGVRILSELYLVEGLR